MYDTRTSDTKDFVNDLGSTVRHNPWPVMLMGTGLLWLLGSTRSGSQVVGGMTERFSDAGSRMRDAARERMPGAHGDQSYEANSRSNRDRTTRRYLDKTKERLSGSAEATRHQAGRLGHVAQSGAQHTRESVASLYEERPLLMGGLTLALGAALGALIPESRREDALMGDYRDDLMERAREQGEAQVEKARRVAEAAREAAEEEARQQGQGNGSSQGQTSSERPQA